MECVNNTENGKVAIVYGNKFVTIGNAKYPSDMSVSCIDKGGGLVKLTLSTELRYEFGDAMPKDVFNGFTPAKYLHNKLNEFLGRY